MEGDERGERTQAWRAPVFRDQTNDNWPAIKGWKLTLANDLISPNLITPLSNGVNIYFLKLLRKKI